MVDLPPTIGCEPTGESCTVQVDGAVAVLTLADPADARLRGIVLDEVTLSALLAALREVSADRGVRAAVLTGSGGAFCLGADPADLQAGCDDPAVVASLLDRLAALVEAVACGRLPIVAAVNGHAAGAGLALALACDHRVIAQRAALDLAYARLGVPPDGGSTFFLPRVVGHGRARQLLLDQPVIRAGQALRDGLVDEVVPAEEVVPAALRRANELAVAPPLAVAAIRRLLDGGALRAQLAAERAEFLSVLPTADVRRGLAAARTGRLAVFEGT